MVTFLLSISFLMPLTPLCVKFFSLVFGGGGDHLGTNLLESKGGVWNLQKNNVQVKTAIFTWFLCILQKEKHRFLYILKSAAFEKLTHFLSILLHVFFGQDLFNIFCGCAINLKYVDNRLILK